MRIKLMILLMLLIPSSILPQNSLQLDDIANYFNGIKVRIFDYDYAVSQEGNIFVVYRGPQEGEGEKLYLDILDPQGHVVKNRLIILDNFIFTQGYQKCYTYGDEVKIVVGFWERPGVVATYNFQTDKLDILFLDGIKLSSIYCTYDQGGGFHLVTHNSDKTIYAKIVNNKITEKREISYDIRILHRNLLDLQNQALVDKERAPSLSNNYCVYYFKNHLIVIYYIDHAPLESAPAEAVSEIFFDKFGIEVLDLDNYKYNELKMYDIQIYTSEKIENVYYPKINVFSSQDKFKSLIVYLGAKNMQKHNLCKIELNAEFQPLKPSEQKITNSAVLTTISKYYVWDFVIEYKNPYVPSSFHFIGFEKDLLGNISRYYYAEKHRD